MHVFAECELKFIEAIFLCNKKVLLTASSNSRKTQQTNCWSCLWKCAQICLSKNDSLAFMILQANEFWSHVDFYCCLSSFLIIVQNYDVTFFSAIRQQLGNFQLCCPITYNSFSWSDKKFFQKASQFITFVYWSHEYLASDILMPGNFNF